MSITAKTIVPVPEIIISTQTGNYIDGARNPRHVFERVSDLISVEVNSGNTMLAMSLKF